MELTRENLSQEVSRFKDTMQEEALSTSEKSIFLEKRGNVGLIVFDQHQEKANKLSTPNMIRLLDLLIEIEQDKEIGCLVLISRKPSIFIAGADIAEIQTLNSGEQSAESLMKLQAVFTYLEQLPIPSIAAIHGAALGGGLELVLACDYRMATKAPATRLGLPEVQLGVIPGWGGTQRLPRLIGLPNALDLILTGRHVDGRKAEKLGLVDRLVPPELLEEKALEWAEELAKKRKKRTLEKGAKENLIEKVPVGKWIIFDQAKKKVLDKTKGNYPAPLKAISVIKATLGGKLETGLRKEAEAFMELVATPESKNLINVFYLTEMVKKDKGVDTEVSTKTINKGGVLGAGVMGGGIAQLFAAKGIRVRMKDINWDAITKGYQAAHKIFAKKVKRRKMKPNELTNAMELIEGTTEYQGFKNCDLIVEAVVEDLNIKKKVFEEIDKVVKPEAILASNTSSLSVSAMAEVCKDPTRVVGMHFFNPVHMMPLVEVIRGEKTSDEAVATLVKFSKKLGKFPIVVKDAPGFVVNRVLGPYLNEAVFLMLDGVTPVDMDSVMEKFGMPMGPCTLLDEVGLDVALKVSKVLFGAFGERMQPPSFMEQVVKDGRLGKKNKKGIYLWSDDRKKKTEDRGLLTKFDIKSRESHLTDEAIERRMTFLMVNEAARILEENVARSAADIDVGMIFGTGFAPFRGGLLRFADTVGADTIVGDLELFTRNYGPRFQPCSYLQQMAVEKKKFY